MHSSNNILVELNIYVIVKVGVIKKCRLRFNKNREISLLTKMIFMLPRINFKNIYDKSLVGYR